MAPLSFVPCFRINAVCTAEVDAVKSKLLSIGEETYRYIKEGKAADRDKTEELERLKEQGYLSDVCFMNYQDTASFNFPHCFLVVPNFS